jgi:hypothetical protein
MSRCESRESPMVDAKTREVCLKSFAIAGMLEREQPLSGGIGQLLAKARDQPLVRS